MRVAILDDYQNVAVKLADWSRVERAATVVVFNDHVEDVDEDALVAALTSQSIGGAALDVFAREPLPLGHPFRELENVIATPHIGYVAEDLYRTFYRDAASAIANWLKEQSA